jgi:hypothetical protein
MLRITTALAVVVLLGSVAGERASARNNNAAGAAIIGAAVGSQLEAREGGYY